MTQKAVGIIGGMGPDATLELMRRVMDATPAQDDPDHIRMLVDNNPKIPSRLKAILDNSGDNPGPVIAKMAKGLEQAGADFLVMPCNTVHYYLDYVEQAVEIPVWNLIRLSLSYIHEHYPVKRVGILASTASQQINLFGPVLEEFGLEAVYPDQATQALVMQVIMAVKAGQLSDALVDEYNHQIAQMPDVELYLLGCSELSVARKRHHQQVPVVDALQVLAEAIVAECIGQS